MPKLIRSHFRITSAEPRINLRTVGPSKDYADLATWYTARKGRDLTRTNTIEIAECSGTGTADSSTVAMTDGATGFITDARRYVKIQSTGDNRHRGVFDSSKYFFTGNLTTSGSATTGPFFLKVDGLQVKPASTPAAFNVVSAAGSHANYEFSNCITDGQSAARTLTGFSTALRVGQVLKVWNCIFYNVSGISLDCNSGSVANATTYVHVVSNTFANCTSGLDFATNAKLKVFAMNNLFYNVTTVKSGTGMFSYANNNASSGATACGGVLDRVNQTFTFQDAAGLNFLLQPYDAGAKGFGTNAYRNEGWNDYNSRATAGYAYTYPYQSEPFVGIETDILANYRSMPWSIGAHHI